MSVRYAFAAVLAVALSASAAAQSPGLAPTQDEPLPAFSDADRGDDPFDRLGVWAEGPSYAVDADADGRSAWGSGRILRAAIPGQTDTVEVELPGSIRDIDIEWPLAYVATQHFGDSDANGLEIVDLEEGLVIGRIAGLFALGVHVEGDLAYIAAFDGGWALHTADVSTPETATLLGVSIVLDGYLRGVDVRDGVAYVGAGAGGLHVLDVTNPGAPVLVRTVPVPGYTRYLDVAAGGLAVAYGTYTNDTGGVAFYSLATATSPQLAADASVGRVVEDAVWTSTTTVAAAGSQGGVFSIGTDGDIDALVVTEDANLVAGSNRVAVEPGGTVLSADYYYGGFRVDFGANSAERAWVGASFGFDFAVEPDDGRVVYAAAGSYGVVRLEADEEDGLIETGRAHGPSWNYTRGVAQDAERLYVADGFSGIQVVDKATLTTIAQNDAFFVDQIAYDQATGTIVAAGNGQAVLASWSPSVGVQILDVLDGLPASSIAIDPAQRGVAYIGRSDAPSVSILRLGDVPEVVGQISLGDAGNGAAVATSSMQLVVQGEGLLGRLYSLASAESPELLGDIGRAGSTRALAFVSDQVATTGVRSVALTDLGGGTPALLGEVTGLLATPEAVALSQDGLFVTVGQGGIEWFRGALTISADDGPSERVRLAVSPNPTFGPLRIDAGADGARVEIWTVTGRRVAVLDAVGGTASWAGRDASGQPVAAGVYLVRVTAGGDVQTVPVTVVR